MKKGYIGFNKKIQVCFQLTLLLTSLFAFSFLVGSIGFVEAETISNLNVPGGVSSGALPAGTELTVTEAIEGTSFTSAGGSNIIISKASDLKIFETSKGGVAIYDGNSYELTESQMKSFLDSGAATRPEGSSATSRLLGFSKGTGLDAIASGLQWAGIAYMAGMLIGGLFGMSEGNTKALSASLAGGFGSYKALSVWKTGGHNIPYLSKIPALSGIVIGAVIFLVMYKTTDVEVVTFDCLAWQAPTGGNDCEICNDDTLPCSEYRCKALGQNCEIVNAGTSEERCVNINPRDVVPPVVRPWVEALSAGHNYVNVRASPPGPGFGIVNLNSSDGCLKAFTPLEFGLVADEPAQCKIDFEHTESFDEMSAYVGGSNLFAYNHTERFSLPSAEAIKNSSLVLENGKDLTFFIRCQDKNGNANEAEYAVKLCVDPTPDNTAPKIEATSVVNGGCVAENVNSAGVEFYTNEPADCRWSFDDQDYDNMVNGMSCSGALYQANAAQLFTCVANLTGISRIESKYYVRCKDQPGKDEVNRNEMKQSFEFSLIGSTGLKMKNLRPNETIFGGVSPTPVELYVETLFGCNNGRAVCQYSSSGDNDDYIVFYDTDNIDGISTQKLSLTAGRQEYFVKCVDEGGNLVEDKVVFDLEIDTSAPVVARIYEEDQMLKIVTVRNSECAYSLDNCDFSFAEGTVMPYANSTVHVAEWNEQKTYYIKCRDEFRNEDAGCSVVVKPSRNFL
ncbi:MAG: hypothetical protein V1889_01295 [archaeon]